MRAIVSVIENRARMMGITPQQVVANSKEFNAYGKALPKGVNAYRDLAEQAIREVQTTGPIHTGTFYATPGASKNLPKGLKQVTSTSGHRYYADPQNRSINSAVGFRQPNPSRAPAVTAYAPAPSATGALRAIEAQTSGRAVPTPTTAPRSVSTRSNPSLVAAASSLPAGLQSSRGGRVGPNTTTGIPTPSARPVGASLQKAQTTPQTQPDATRFGSFAPGNMPKSMMDRFAEKAGVTGSRVAPQSVTTGLAPSRPVQGPNRPASTALTAAQASNLASRLSPQTSLAMAPTPTSAPRSISVAAPSAASIRSAASLPSGLAASAKGSRVASTPTRAVSAPTVSAPTRTTGFTAAQEGNLATRLGGAFTPTQSLASLRTASASISAAGLTPAQATNLASRLGTSTPTKTAPSLGSLLGVSAAQAAPVGNALLSAPAATSFAGKIGSPRSIEGQLPANALGGVLGPTSVPTPTSAPRTISAVAAPTSRPVAPTRTIAAPVSRAAPVVSRAVTTPTARPTFSAAPVAPTVTQAPSLASRLGLTPGRIAGAALGSVVAGPIGGIVGGWLGGRVAAPAAAPATAPMASAPAARGGIGSGLGGMFGGGMNGMGSSGMGGNRSATGTNGTGRAGGVGTMSGGFAGFGERDSAVGTDGGKVGGSSRSSASSSSKSSSSGKSSGGKGKK
ncbi:hypothetical protein [Aureimonas pseudogalii]|uniref:Uncharacterized protein n=1 Tax=Aureimonas pseudogalii TaxID=1744844 RepID=A0A7W6EG07_9HYPH|nr:hypothetical protein [Aureimonas pseudogalii]MBB3997214.1 hypothetical protein [Aureimonas pseudogalii]